MKFRISAAAAAVACLSLAGPSQAANILISNDDGFETANIRALYETLVAAGHSVIVSAPTQNQSGQGGRVQFLEPIQPLSKASKYGTIPVGAAGAGQDPTNSNFYYVDGSPVMSLLYGLDVIAPRVWGKAPDLIISGPNEGNNTGAVNVSSGTFSNALYGINRGIPSIAVSDGVSTQRSFTTLVPGTDRAYMVAARVRDIVSHLANRPKDGPGFRMPAKVGLNVNIPASSSCTNPTTYAVTEVSVRTTAQPVFYEDISTSPVAAGAGLGSVHLPGVSVLIPGIPAPPGVSIPADTNPLAEAAVLASCQITVSIIQGTTDIASPKVNNLRVVLMGLNQPN